MTRPAATIAVLLSACALASAQEAVTPKTFLGVRMDADHSALAGKGVLVLEVVAGSAAERAGLAIGDVVTSFAGAEVKVVDDLFQAIQGRAAGDEVEVVVLRAGREETLQPTLGPWPDPMPESEAIVMPDPLTVEAVESRVAEQVAAFAERRVESLDRAVTEVRGIASYYRTAVGEDERVGVLVARIEWCRELLRAGIQPPVNVVDAGGNLATRIPELIDLLGSPEFEDRSRASRGLRAIGEAAHEALEKAAGSDDPEVAYRAAELLEGWEVATAPDEYRPVDYVEGAGASGFEGPLTLAIVREGSLAGTTDGTAARPGDRLVGFVVDLR